MSILRYLLSVICQRTKTKVDIWVLGIQHCVIFRGNLSLNSQAQNRKDIVVPVADTTDLESEVFHT